ncbi:DUF4442 domain-containing protein [Halobacteriaceae archaeon GCM10025711]
MPESFRTRLYRLGFNLFPAYRRTGGRVTYIADDWREVRVKLPLNWTTRNYVGTIFGGSMYAAVDPFYMMMLLRILGPEYTVWDKAATIEFEKPGRSTLYARFSLDDDEIRSIRRALDRQPSVNRVYEVSLRDEDGVVHATVEKTVYVRRDDPEHDSG